MSSPLCHNVLRAQFTNMTSTQIETKLRKVNEALKKYKHINKKAFDQYNSFTTQREQLLKRRKELDTSQASIEELIEHLDQAKDEAIERTFKQVSKEFSTIFAQLVPAGHGRLVIQRKTDRPSGKGGRNAAEDSDEEPATGVENYTGVGISVSFNSKVADEQQKIQQLSGGQKSRSLGSLVRLLLYTNSSQVCAPCASSLPSRRPNPVRSSSLTRSTPTWTRNTVPPWPACWTRSPRSRTRSSFARRSDRKLC